MPRERRRFSQRRVQVLCGLLLAGALYAELEFNADYEPVLAKGTPVVYAAEQIAADPFERLIRHDPLAALLEARQQLVRESRDYVCNFVKQERIGSTIRAEQEVSVKFRPRPYSVMMHFVRNPGLAQRAIYVKDKWNDDDADDPALRELAVCQPGKGLSLLLKSIKQPIHGMMAKRTSRRSIDEWGFERALDLLITYCQMANEKGELKLDFKGESHFDGRPVWVIRRVLPYTAEGGVYPDRIASIYIDKAYHVPVAVYCYSADDTDPMNLLGKYEYRNVRFSPGLTDKDFDPATYGM